eukprot:COSAG06_NODE_46123_length_349_cov_0.824000_1_plen_21_part_01
MYGPYNLSQIVDSIAGGHWAN